MQGGARGSCLHQSYAVHPLPFRDRKVPKMNPPADQAMQQAVERRRSAEAARKARIFDPRVRILGIDTRALGHQVEDKKHRQDLDMQRDRAFGEPVEPVELQTFINSSSCSSLQKSI